MVRGGGLVDVVMAGGFRLFFGFWAWPLRCCKGFVLLDVSGLVHWMFWALSHLGFFLFNLWLDFPP